MLRRAKARDQGRALQHVRLEACDLHYYTGLAKAGPTMPPCLPLGRLARLTRHGGGCVAFTQTTTAPLWATRPEVACLPRVTGKGLGKGMRSVDSAAQ